MTWRTACAGSRRHQTHPWLLDLPPVNSGAVGSYLGVSLLLADDTAVGALCVYGPHPREWTDLSRRRMADELARLVGR